MANLGKIWRTGPGLLRERARACQGRNKGAAALKSAQCRKYILWNLTLEQSAKYILWNICFGSQLPLFSSGNGNHHHLRNQHGAPPVHDCAALITRHWHTFHSQYSCLLLTFSVDSSSNILTLTFQHGGAVPAELPEDGCPVVGGGGEHKAGAVQRLHRGCQVSFYLSINQWIVYGWM